MAARRFWSTMTATMFLGCVQPAVVRPQKAPVAVSEEPRIASATTVSPVAAAAAFTAAPVAVVRGPIWVSTAAPVQSRARRDCSPSAAPALRIEAAHGEPAATLGGAFEPDCPHTLGADLGASERAPGGFPAPASELLSIFRVDW